MKKLVLIAFVTAAAFAASPASAAPITFHSGDGGDILVRSIVLPGAITAITPHSAWGDVSDDAGLAAHEAKWISYADTGVGGSVAPNVQSRDRDGATAVFKRAFDIGGPGTFSLWILADDTAAVDLVGPAGTTVLYNAYMGQINPCAPGYSGPPVGCTEQTMGHVALTDLAAGHYELMVYAMQTNNDVFGTQYAGSYSPVPEPGSMLLLGSGLFGLAGAVRRRLRK